MDQSTLNERTREALRIGKLPKGRPDRIWGGPAPGVECSVCGRNLSPGDTSLEAEFADPLQPTAGRIAYTFHVQCFATWEQERDSLAVAGDDPFAGVDRGDLPRGATDGTITRRELNGHHRDEPT